MKDSRNKLVVIFVFSLFINLFLYSRVGSAGGGLLLIGVALLGIGIFGSYHKIGSRSPETWVTLLAIAAAISLQLVSSPLRIMLIVLGTLAGYISGAYMLLRGYTPRGIGETISAWVQVPGEYVKSMLTLLVGGNNGSRIFVRLRGTKDHSTLRSILIGIGVGLPIVIWMTSLLSSADPVFGHFVESILSKEFLERIPVRLFVTALTIVALVPTLGMAFARPFVSPVRFLTQLKWQKEISVVLAMIVALLGTFLVIQWPYVFVRVASETHLVEFGVVTYSEYVQKGFSELVRVAFIVFAVSWASYLISRNKTRVLLHGWLQTILGIEFVLFVISLVRRIMLYTEYHGLSLARLYGLAFLVWIAGMSVILAMRFVTRQTLARYEIGWTIVAWVVTIAINMQTLVVRTPPTVNNRVDYVYLSRLSADGAEGWQHSYQWATETLDRTVSTPGIIGRDARRDFFYASMIVDNLTYTYARLASLYGNAEQQAQMERERQIKRFSGLDRFFSWSLRESQAFATLTESTTYMDLVTYQRRAQDLRQRIDRQPASERDYDIDISFSTPLL